PPVPSRAKPTVSSARRDGDGGLRPPGRQQAAGSLSHNRHGMTGRDSHFSPGANGTGNRHRRKEESVTMQQRFRQTSQRIPGQPWRCRFGPPAGSRRLLPAACRLLDWLQSSRGDMVWNALVLISVLLPLASLTLDVPRYYVL